MIDIDTPIELSINRSYKGKAPKFTSRAEKNAWWGPYNAQFKNTTMSARQLAAEVAKGFGFTVKLSGYREKENFVSAQHLGTDHDTEDLRSSLDTLARDPFIAQYAMFLYPTASHTPEKPRARVFYRLDRAITDRGVYEELMLAMLARYPDADPSAKDAARLWFGAPNCEIRWIGNVLPVSVLLPDHVIEAPGGNSRLSGTNGKHAPAPPIPDVLTAGHRYPNLFSLAGTMRRRNVSPDAILAALKVENAARCKPPKTDDELQDIVDGIQRYPPEPDTSTVDDIPADYVPPEPEFPPESSTPTGQPLDSAADPAADGQPEATLPAIQANGRELRDISENAIRALTTTGDVFVRSGVLVWVKVDEKEHASIETINENALKGMLARAANFYNLVIDKDDKATRKTVSPKMEVVRDILNLKSWEFPPIEGVVGAPVIRPDGTILCAPGYDRATALFYRPTPGLVMPEIPANPTQADIAKARALLYDPISDFPFVNEASRDNAIGTTITMVARPMINGATPIPVLDAPQQGSGKSLLGATLAAMGTGEMPIAGAAPNDPEEWRKRITAELGTGKRVIVFDNVTGTLNDPSLAAVSTARVWEDRRLGTNSTIRLPALAQWMITGNNITVGGDLVRRCYSIRLDAKMSRPWQRDGFKYPDIEKHIRENRGELIGAALTLARAWVVAGKPKPTGIRMGGFESWANVVGGIMQFSGAKDFLANLTEFYENADDDTPAWESFIGKLKEVFGDLETTASEIFIRFLPDPNNASTGNLSQYVPNDLAGLLDVKTKAKFIQKLGYELKARKDKRHGDTQARVKQGASSRNTTWLFKVGNE